MRGPGQALHHRVGVIMTVSGPSGVLNLACNGNGLLESEYSVHIIKWRAVNGI
jgi:hypothetical protein